MASVRAPHRRGEEKRKGVSRCSFSWEEVNNTVTVQHCANFFFFHVLSVKKVQTHWHVCLTLTSSPRIQDIVGSQLA